MEPDKAYESEQRSLQQEREGDDIQVTIPQDPEVDSRVWRDVEPMLYRGFLTKEAEVNGVYFVFKSLNHHEFETLRFRGGFRGAQAQGAFWNTFLSFTVFMVDGVNLLENREAGIHMLGERFFSQLASGAKADIIRHIGEVNRRASVAVTLTEAYAMESVSRYRWLQLQGLDLTSVSVSGIPGTERLGLNWAQQIWRAINLMEDRNATHEREWENAKFIGSCFAGKGLQKVYTQDTERRRKEKEERMTRKDQLLREVLMGEKIGENQSVLPGVVITAPRTVTELATQLEKDLRGDQDWHDQVIRDHEERIKQQYQARLEQQKMAADEHAREFGPRHVHSDEQDLSGLSEKEVQERMLRRKQMQAQAAARRQIHTPDEKTQNFMDRWGATGPEVTTEVSTTKRPVTDAQGIPPRRPTGIPFRRGDS